jgi:beta-glucosidase
VAQRLGDRVKHFFTLNEPHAYIEGGLKQGRHAPGLSLPQADVLLAAHHTLLAHGRATQVLRAEIADVWVAMAPVLISAVPRSPDEADVEAARKFTFSMYGPDLRVTSFWMDPVFGRGYPVETETLFGNDMPPFTDAELNLIAQPLDAVGFNLYDAYVVAAGEDGGPVILPPPPGAPSTSFNWAMTPQAHEYGPRFCFERYNKPIVISENGISCRDFVQLDGQVPDDDRIDFIQTHVAALGRAASEVPIHGYFHWSLLDNFEWNHGYRERFGLVHVDYQTMTRTKKKSFYAYRDLIQAHSPRSRSRCGACGLFTE